MQLPVASKSDQGTRCVQNLIAVSIELQATRYDGNDYSRIGGTHCGTVC